MMSVNNENKNEERMGGESHHVTTDFVDDGISLDLTYSSKYEDDIVVRDTSIPDFLAKPQIITRGTWTSASSANAELYSFSIKDKLFSSPLWLKKLENFNLFRGTACVRIQINANPFQQGRLLMHYVPCYTNLIDSGTPAATLYNVDLATKTTQAGIELDARDTAAEMRMPYVAPAHYVDRANTAASYDWGTVFLSVMSPLRTGAAGDLGIDYQVFLWFEDFELAAPCFLTEAMASKIKPARKRKNIRFASALAAEKNIAASTPIATALSDVARIANGLSSVPMIAPLAGPVAWAANLASGVASVFGWSKPQLSVAPGFMVTREMPYAATADGVDTSYPLSLSTSNCLAISDCCSIRGEDEMSFAFLKRIQSNVGSFEWTSAISAGTVLYSKAVSPLTIGKLTTRTIGTSIATYETGSPLSYMAHDFRMYRGSIKMRLSFVKTIFHSGRLLITFNPVPGISYTSPAVTIDGSTPMLREIIDIRDTKEIDLVLPYYAASNYLDVVESIGTLSIVVLSELRVPEAASGTVEALIYYGGGDDFEYQVPRSTFAFGPYSTQSNGVSGMSHVIGGDPTHEMMTSHMEQSIGESFTSVKQLLSRYSTIVSSVALTGPSKSALGVWPYYTNVTRSLPGTGDLVDRAIGGDAFCTYSPFYAFYRGSMRVRSFSGASVEGFLDSYAGAVAPSAIETVTNYGNIPLLSGSMTTTNTDWNSPVFKRRTSLGSQLIPQSSQSGFVVPYAGRYHCSLVAPQIGTNTVSMNVIPTTGATEPEHSQSRIRLMIAQSSGVPIVLYRSAGDDFQFSNFIGTVPRLTAKV